MSGSSGVYWVLRDLSTEDGATYAWVYGTREQAREQGRLYKDRPDVYPTLGPVERWTVLRLTRRYEPMSCNHLHYWRRKR